MCSTVLRCSLLHTVQVFSALQTQTVQVSRVCVCPSLPCPSSPGPLPGSCSASPYTSSPYSSSLGSRAVHTPQRIIRRMYGTFQACWPVLCRTVLREGRWMAAGEAGPPRDLSRQTECSVRALSSLTRSQMAAVIAMAASPKGRDRRPPDRMDDGKAEAAGTSCHAAAYCETNAQWHVREEATVPGALWRSTATAVASRVAWV